MLNVIIQARLKGREKGRYHDMGEGVITSLNRVFHFCRNYPKTFKSRCKIDVTQVHDLFYWALLVIRDSTYDECIEGAIRFELSGWNQRDFHFEHPFFARIQQSLEAATSLRICPNRLWNLVVISD
jgi:hypothetical protein